MAAALPSLAIERKGAAVVATLFCAKAFPAGIRLASRTPIAAYVDTLFFIVLLDESQFSSFLADARGFDMVEIHTIGHI